jgi:hypothetical protein
MQGFRVIFKRLFLYPLVNALLILGILLIVSSCSNGDATIYTTTYTTTTPTTTPIYWPTPSPYLTAPIDISTLSDGQTIRVNLVRFIGTLPSPDATVMVNNSQVTVSDGQYYVYLDLLPGENVIEVKTITGAEIETQNVHVFFEPPLVVRLFYPDFAPDVNYLENPLVTIRGDVSNPSAEVLVNGIKQEVRPDGTFSTEVLAIKESDVAMAVAGSESALYPSVARAVATLGDEIDTFAYPWVIGGNGRPGRAPGWSISTVPSIITHDQSVILKAGESVIIGFGVRVPTPLGNPISSVAKFDITRLSNPAGGSYLPMSQGLNIHVEPSNCSIYPKIEYYFPIIIETEPDLTPGDYYFNVAFTGYGYSSSGSRLTVSIE